MVLVPGRGWEEDEFSVFLLSEAGDKSQLPYLNLPSVLLPLTQSWTQYLFPCSTVLSIHAFHLPLFPFLTPHTVYTSFSTHAFSLYQELGIRIKDHPFPPLYAILEEQTFPIITQGSLMLSWKLRPRYDFPA